MGKGTATHLKHPRAIDYDALRREVKAAHEELQSQGVYPGLRVLARMLHRAEGTIHMVRSELFAEGLIVMPPSPGRAAEAVCDPLAEQPDDPDAAEVQARIAEIRAVKEASPQREPTVGVLLGRFHRPNRRHSRQRVVA